MSTSTRENVNTKKVIVKALYDFVAENDAELSIRVGDIITVVAQEDEGWWEGECNGKQGLFPSNYVESYTSISSNSIPPQTPRGTRPPSQFPKGQEYYKKASIIGQRSQGNLLITSGGSTMVIPTNNISINGNSFTARPLAQNIPKTIAIEMKYEEKKELKTRFGAWATNMGEMTGYACILFGVCQMIWGFVNFEVAGGYFTPFVGIYTCILGFMLVPFEKSYGLSRAGSRVPVRTFLYSALSIFMFFSLPGVITGVFMLCTGILNFIAAMLEEQYDKPERTQLQKEFEKQHKSQAASFFETIRQKIIEKKEQNKVGVLVFVAVYFIGNLILFIVVVIYWFNKNKNEALGLSGYAPIAKGFGNLLDMNCSLILVPVLRTTLRWLYNKSTSDQTCFARFLRFVLQFMPIDKNISFHKLIARMIVFASVGHMFFHFTNYALVPKPTMDVFGLSPWITGPLILLIMLILYSGARENTKRGQFEIFWYSHHLFILFFILLICHGKGGFGPNYWKWFLLPGTLYIIERILRVYRSGQKVNVLSCTFMKPDVMCLEFAKEGIFARDFPYKEGQYVFINSPPISAIQWHPFTISSAPQEDTVTVHIRTCGEGSWTIRLQQYMMTMGGNVKGKSYVKLDRQGPTGKEPGKYLGPDGKVMIRLDGPYSAPTQHVGEYKQVMVIGAGIGVTPVSSTLKSIVYQKWKFNVGETNPEHAYFYWLCSYKDIDAFRWLIRIIKDAQDEVVHMRTHNAQMKTKTFEFHIFVTSVPKEPKPFDGVIDDEVGFWGVPYKEEKSKVEKVRANFPLVELYKCMLEPKQPHIQLEDIHIYNGRPNWGERFAAVSSKHPNGEIGVLFCGNPVIGKDLSYNCSQYSRGRNNGIFKLHKENF